MPVIDQALAADIKRIVTQAIAEDVGSGDLTAGLLASDSRVHARVIARQRAVLCGAAWFDEVFAQLDDATAVAWHHDDGDQLDAGATVCEITGAARPVLSGERTALNFIQMLSGTATATASYVSAIAGTGARILDTRKTIPGLRLAQKYAVRCGGGSNHRIGLFDAVLIKENHIAAAGGIAAAVEAAAAHADAVMIEIEVESLQQLELALTTRVDRILLDNFDPASLSRAAALRNAIRDCPVELEASGGITLANIRAVAETGVDFISVGAITKDVVATDYSMRID